MSPTQNLLDLAVALKAATGGQIDATTARAMTGWTSAWHELTDEWALALTDLANQADDDGRWPSRATVLRSDRALAALAHTAERINELVAASGDVVAGDLSALVGMAEDHQLRMIAAQFPEDYPPGVGNLVNPDAMDAIVTRTQTSIVALSAPIAPDVEAAIKSVLIKGVAMGEHPSVAAREMLQRVGDRFEGGRRRAETIARTSMLDAQRDAARASRIANADVCTGWMWLSALQTRTCISCIAMHGSIHPVDEPGPHDHPRGRCAAVPITAYFQPGKTGPEWFAEQPEKTQRSMLGPKRYEAWKAGKYPPEQWAVRRTNKGWRDSYGPGPVGGIKAAKPAPARIEAEKVLRAAAAAEPDTTRLMRALADSAGGTLEGLDYRLKGVDSLTRKIADEAAEKGIAPSVVARQVSDALRYTVVVDDAKYTSAAASAVEQFTENGWGARVKNYWRVPDNPYQGVNVALTSPAGQAVELQVHTKTSFDVKNGQMHTLYEESRASTTTAARRAELREQMSALSASIPVPSGILNW